MPTETVKVGGAGGRRLDGRLERPTGDVRGWALFAHCFSCGKEGLAAIRVSRALAARGIGVLRFDFAGIGGADSHFDEGEFSADVADLTAAAALMGAQGRPIGLMVGHSLGGAAALLAAASIDSLKALATIGAPADAAHVIRQFGEEAAEIEAKGSARVTLAGRPFTVTRGFLEDLRRHAEQRAAGTLKCGLLVMHSPQDETVGIEEARGIYDAAKHPKSFVALPGADHLLTREADADYAAGVIAAWAERYL